MGVVWIPARTLHDYLAQLPVGDGLVALLLFVLYVATYPLVLATYLTIAHGLPRGQTLGKWLMRLRVEVGSLDPFLFRRTWFGFRISHPTTSVQVGGGLGAMAGARTIAQLCFALFLIVGLQGLVRIPLFGFAPFLDPIASSGLTLLGLSDLLVMLLNDRQRALHDFIAGSVVVERTSRSVLSAAGGNPAGYDGVRDRAAESPVFRTLTR